MVLRALALCFAALALAPFQCARDPDPEKAIEDDPAEALYGLAGRFAKAGNRPARRDTLRYIVERYPTSRFAELAKDDLEAMGEK